jgi:hypothetical protein
LLTRAKNTKGKANGPNKIPIANQKGLLAFLFAAIKYNRTPKNAENNIKYSKMLILPFTNLFLSHAASPGSIPISHILI